MGGAGGEVRMCGGKAAKRGTRRETGTPESLEAYVGRVLIQDFSHVFLHYKILPECLTRVLHSKCVLQASHTRVNKRVGILVRVVHTLSLYVQRGQLNHLWPSLNCYKSLTSFRHCRY